MRAVFFGTPEFAVPSLSKLLEPGVEVPLVVTQPDRPVGRHATPLPSAVARLAAIRGLSTQKPENLRGNSELVQRIREAAPDVGVVVAYGRILPKELLEIPPLGFVNVHASLLPRHRGASPVAAAILSGDEETGVSTMQVAEELDAGPVFLQRRVPIGPRENAGALSRRLAEVGAQLLAETLREVEARTIAPRPQQGEPSFSRPIRREDGEIDWSLPAEEIERRLRAFSPWPGVHGFLGGARIKILAAFVGPPVASEPGRVWIENDRALAAAGAGSSLVLEMVQRSGKKPVRGIEFLRILHGLPAHFDPHSSRGSR